MKRINILILLFSALSVSNSLIAQQVLSKEEAVRMALENNLGIELVKNLSDIAKSNTSKNNSGKLPIVGVNGGYNYRLDNTTANLQNGQSTELAFAPSQAANASIAASYTLFDGFFRKYNTQQLKERYALSQLEVKATMENVAAQTMVQYYQIASIVDNLNTLEEAINISTRRLERAEEEFDFGKGSGLAVLNAQVDLNNDSLSFMNASIQLDNAKRLLNNILVAQNTMDYNVDSNADFITGLSKDQLRENMFNQNLAISQIDKTIEIGNISIDMANARKLPTIASNLSYGYSYNKNNSASFLSSQNTNGLNAGLTFSWNLFDGGATRHALEQAKLNNIGIALQKEQLIENLNFEFDNAWANYENRLFIYDTQVNNVEISRTNFERTEERFKIGQITNIDYRQAQLNLLNAETALNNAKFQVKISEVEILLLSGNVLD